MLTIGIRRARVRGGPEFFLPSRERVCHCCPCHIKNNHSPEQIPHCRIVDIGREPRGEGSLSEEPVAMRRPMGLVPLDRTMQLPLTLAGGLRTTFDKVVSSPLPDRLAVLMRQLHADHSERSGAEHNNGPSATDRRGQR